MEKEKEEKEKEEKKRALRWDFICRRQKGRILLGIEKKNIILTNANRKMGPGRKDATQWKK